MAKGCKETAFYMKYTLMAKQTYKQGRSQDFGLGDAQITNHTGENQKKVFKIRFRIFD